jgi:hypothetical protein
MATSGVSTGFVPVLFVVAAVAVGLVAVLVLFREKDLSKE